ncbi:hypothetical protein NE237_016317 [Protea cynaroides]|uniref:Uncharacterized protein n=1 Tax=Protea cynaroides TaxID=273540 RepID=A0A9Q0JS70_9MAGN|nr:hypothetical protein NE237_016317 [Protea cynaroides]
MLPSLKNPSSPTSDKSLFPNPSMNDILVFPAEPVASAGSGLVIDEAAFPPLVASPQPKENPPLLKPSVAEEKMEGDGAQPRNSFSNSESRPNPEDGGVIKAGPMDFSGPGVEPDAEYEQAWKQHDWSKARAKKKRPEGSSGQATTRLESCRRTGVLSAPVLLSNSHWRTDSQSENLVAQSAPFPVKVTNSKSSPLLCPELDQPLCPDETLSSNKKSDLNPKPTDSSAGHTPFLNQPLSVSRSKNEVGGAGTRKPVRVSSPSSVKNLEGGADISLVSTVQTWEGDQIFVPWGKKVMGMKNVRVLV